MGLKKAVYEGISWFFDNVERGIILENDCVPSQSFFKFCSEMLLKYENVNNVMHISGINTLPTKFQNKNIYYFSKYSDVWGWATWRKAWKKMDFDLLNWRNFEKSKKFDYLFGDFWEKKYWQIISHAALKHKTNSWAYRWLFSIWESGGKCISPGVNLVENIGLVDNKRHINTNIKILRSKAKKISMNPKLASNDFSVVADKYNSKKRFRISLLMDLAQWVYYTFFRRSRP